MMGTEPSMRFKGGVILKTKMEKTTKYIHTLLIWDSLFPGFLILDLSWYRFCFLYFFVDPWFHAILFISFPSLHLSNDGFEPSILEDKQIIAKMMIFKCNLVYLFTYISSYLQRHQAPCISVFLEVYLPYDPSCPAAGRSLGRLVGRSVGWWVSRLVGRSVCHNFLEGRQATLLCSYRALVF